MRRFLILLCPVLAAACGGSGDPSVNVPPVVTPGEAGSAPAADGASIIAYDLVTIEDASACGTPEPRTFDDEMVVDWHSDTQVTIYFDDGLWRVEALLSDDGTYAYDGPGGPCEASSHLNGRIDRHEGESHLDCVQNGCTVVYSSTAHSTQP